MTKKFFWENPYQTRHDTTIATVHGEEVTVNSTIFYAFSGGQESDRGSIAGYPVLDARKNEFEIFYTLPAGHGLEPGQAVQMEIDWARRYRLMRLHFAAELVLELFYQSLGAIDKVGAHIAQEKARIDFIWRENISPLLPRIADAANSLIEANLEIRSAFADEQNERRYWEITGFSRVPCGGTHLKRTGEVGLIKLKRNNIGCGKERVEIFLDS